MRCIICGAGDCSCGGSSALLYSPLGEDMALLTSGANPASANAAYVANERLYLDRDGNVVKEGDPSRVELLVGVNGVLPRDQAARYGLIEDAPAQQDEPTTLGAGTAETAAAKAQTVPDPPKA